MTPQQSALVVWAHGRPRSVGLHSAQAFLVRDYLD